jgi:hypothetical protein
MTDVMMRKRRSRDGQGSSGATLKAHGSVRVSAIALATHFGCAHQYIHQLVQQAVIEKGFDGKFDQDQSRLKYIHHLRA